MVKELFRKNYLELKVRISYDEKTDSINITSKDKHFSVMQKFGPLNRGKNAEYALRSLLEDQGLIPKENFKIIPSHADFNNAINTDEWDKFPLGLFGGGEILWDSSLSPNLLIAGSSGSGKSTIQQNIIFHCLRHPEKWVVLGIDLTRVELTRYMKYGAPLTKVATNLDAALETVNSAYDEMQKRFRIMEQNNVTDLQELSDAPPAWMIMINESLYLLNESGSQTLEGKEEDLIKKELKNKLSKIAYLGRTVGIQLVMEAYRIDSQIIDKNFKDGFTARIAAGSMEESASQALLDNNKGSHLIAAIKGRGHFQQSGKGSDFQGYLSKHDWPYEAGIVKRDQ